MSVNKYYAVYYAEPRVTYYWGKVLKVFSSDVESPISQVEMRFLKKKTISSSPAQWRWVEINEVEKDAIGIVNAQFILHGPALPDITKGLFKFDDPGASKAFQQIIDKI